MKTFVMQAVIIGKDKLEFDQKELRKQTQTKERNWKCSGLKSLAIEGCQIVLSQA